MQRVGSVRRGRTIATVSLAVATMTLAACTSGSGSDEKTTGVADAPSTSSSSSVTSPDSAPSSTAGTAAVTVAASGGSSRANPGEPVKVTVADGTLESVTLTNASGKVVKGALGTGNTSWQTTEDLGYGKTYTVVATAKDADGAATVKREKITTLTPDNMTQPYFNTVNGTGMDNGATYGVGMIPMINFDEDIPDKDAAEKALTVTTTPKLTGAWYWVDNRRVQWRPKDYYPAGTKVTIAANVYGKDLGNGLYGQSDKTIGYQIGQKRISIANAKTHRVKVYFDNKLVKDYPTSMGKGGYVQNGEISLWTPPGNYTVITHENPANMSSSSYGLDADGPNGYSDLVVPWATKISTDGVYLHELNSTRYAQGERNVSHGCLNLTTERAKWFYKHSRVGDVVQVVKSGGPKLKVWQGGQWSVPWSEWVKGGQK